MKRAETVMEILGRAAAAGTTPLPHVEAVMLGLSSDTYGSTKAA